MYLYLNALKKNVVPFGYSFGVTSNIRMDQKNFSVIHKNKVIVSEFFTLIGLQKKSHKISNKINMLLIWNKIC